MKNILTKKAMTLFELLAVIVIIGIIAAIAFPTVNRLIKNSRMDTVVAQANMFVSAAKTEALAEYVISEKSGTYVFTIGDVDDVDVEEYVEEIVEEIELDTDFQDVTKGYVVVVVSSEGNIESVVLIVFEYNGFNLKEPVTIVGKESENPEKLSRKHFE